MLNPPTVQGRSFRRLLLRRVVDNLLRAKSVPWSSIEKIFSKCPSIWSNGEISSKGVLLHQLFIDEREAEYLLALANVAVSIRQHQDRLWGFLRRLVRSLPNILEVASNIRPLTTEILTILLASEVRYNQGDANHQEALSRMRELLVADILSVLQQTINSCFAGQPFLARSIPLIIGLLEGLSQSKTSLCEVAPTQTDLLLELGNQLLRHRD